MFKKLLLPLLLVIFLTEFAFAQSDWKLKSDVEGIKVYSKDVSGSKYKMLRIECNFESTLSQMVAALLDLKTRTEWIYHTKTIRLVKQVSPTDLYYYSEISLPWPAQNRDFVAHLVTRQNENTKVVTMDGPVTTGLVPPKEGVVRIKSSISEWTIYPVNKNEVKVQYLIFADPGGMIPAWLTNMFSSEGPTQSFKKLKLQLKKPEYKTAILPFIKNY
jgi:hypothetical protein